MQTKGWEGNGQKTLKMLDCTQPVIICSMLRRSGVVIVNFENISHLVLVFLLLTLSR